MPLDRVVHLLQVCGVQAGPGCQDQKGPQGQPCTAPFTMHSASSCNIPECGLRTAASCLLHAWLQIQPPTCMASLSGLLALLPLFSRAMKLLNFSLAHARTQSFSNMRSCRRRAAKAHACIMLTARNPAAGCDAELVAAWGVAGLAQGRMCG